MYTPHKERDFLSYLDDLKYEETMKDHDAYFKSVQIINFDMIHHQCREDPLEKKNQKQSFFSAAIRN